MKMWQNYCTVAVRMRKELMTDKSQHSLPGRVVLRTLKVGSDVKTGNLTVTEIRVVRDLSRNTVEGKPLLINAQAAAKLH